MMSSSSAFPLATMSNQRESSLLVGVSSANQLFSLSCQACTLGKVAATFQIRSASLEPCHQPVTAALFAMVPVSGHSTVEGIRAFDSKKHI